jgi:uncharacterized protein (TIGR03067 family)
MKRTIIQAAFIIVASIVCPVCAAGQKTDQETFQGTWEVTEIIIAGEIVTNRLEIDKVLFSGNKMTWVRKSESVYYTFKLNPDETPKAIDFAPADGGFEGITAYGVYLLNGDTMQLCLSNTADRPTEVASPKGKNWLLMTLKRIRK